MSVGFREQQDTVSLPVASGSTIEARDGWPPCKQSLMNTIYRRITDRIQAWAQVPTIYLHT